MLLVIFLNRPFRTHANVFEPVRTTVLPVEKFLAFSEAASNATPALWRVWTVEERNMLITDILEPMNFAGIFKETQSDTVDGSITPALVEEATSAIEMVKVLFVCRRAPEVQVCNLKVAPKVAGAVAVGLEVMVWSALLVGQPFYSVVGVLMVAIRGEELDSLGPQCRNRRGRVVEVDGEAVSLVAVLHEAEDVVVDVTEEVDLWLDAPVVLHVL